jgi:hypothetical protein
MIARTINWTLRLLIYTGIWTFRFTLTWTLWILRFIVLPLLLRFIRFLFLLLIFTIVGTFTGPRRAARETASEWEEGVLARGVSPAFATNLSPLFLLGAYLLLLAGWLVILGINLLIFAWIDPL